jgi:hypothetical protein
VQVTAEERPNLVMVPTWPGVVGSRDASLRLLVDALEVLYYIILNIDHDVFINTTTFS